MKEDQEGFLYPQIDEQACIRCGMCISVCQEKSIGDVREPINIIAAKNLNESCRMDSSSGGVFSLLAEYVESKGGVIYGADYDDNFRVYHHRGTCREEWQKFRKSKYMQSDLQDCFSEVKADLENELIVLFSGTPCQVEGLKRYLSKTNTDKLITCDVICHGVPSPKIWSEWLNETNKEIGKSFSTINFRDKSKTGWHKSSLSIYGDNGDTLLTGIHRDIPFTKMYFQHYIVRLACHKCNYASFNRVADITLGDYWGVENNYKEFDDDHGVSLVLCNTKKGLDIWRAVKDKTECFTIEKAQCRQPSLIKPNEESKNRALFWKIYRRFGLKKAMKLFKLVKLSSLDKVVVKLERGFMRFLSILK